MGQNNIFASLNTASVSGGDTLDDYLNTPPLQSTLDPITWWFNNYGNSDPLAHMAMDLLSAPGKFFDLAVNFLQYQTWLYSVAGTLVSSWSKIPGLVDKTDCIKEFNSKHKQPNNGGKGRTTNDIDNMDEST
ncbi:hypothetical protein C8J56DRAFT_1062763 [Mycena floridula]|nr:hypothetical protein C8J56DRAFT_1062763 [Mycena floridula]